MPLTQRDGLREHIIASTEKVYVKNFVILDKTEDALVVVSSALRAKRDDDSLRGVGLHDALSHRNREQVALVSEELEASGQVAVVDNIEQTVGSLLGLHLTKVDCL